MDQYIGKGRIIGHLGAVQSQAHDSLRFKGLRQVRPPATHQVENFAVLEDCKTYMRGPDFARNPRRAQSA